VINIRKNDQVDLNKKRNRIKFYVYAGNNVLLNAHLGTC